MHDIIIIGAGTAGLTAAIYGVRAGKSVLVFESGIFGGQIVNSSEVENFPGIKRITGADFAMNLYEQALELGTEFQMNAVTGIDINNGSKSIVTSKSKYTCRTIIIASGNKKRPLGLEKETQLIGNGVSYCATCDGGFFKGRDVAVVGGGNTALEDSIYLSEYCKKVYVIHRRDTFRGEEKLVEVLEKRENVEFILNTSVTQLSGNSRLEGIELTNLVDDSKSSLEIQGLFVAIGQIPQNAPFSPPVDLDEAGYIIAGEDCKTNIIGIFAAGDCRTKTFRQLSTAAGDGTVAALGACEYIYNEAQ